MEAAGAALWTVSGGTPATRWGFRREKGCEALWSTHWFRGGTADPPHSHPGGAPSSQRIRSGVQTAEQAGGTSLRDAGLEGPGSQGPSHSTPGRRGSYVKQRVTRTAGTRDLSPGDSGQILGPLEDLSDYGLPKWPPQPQLLGCGSWFQKHRPGGHPAQSPPTGLPSRSPAF